jgi:hypothetical protein
MPHVVINKTYGTTKIVGSGRMHSFTGTSTGSGVFNPNAGSITTSGDMYLTSGFDIINQANAMSGCAIAVSGNFMCDGQNFQANAPWTLSVAGTAQASGTGAVAYSDASGGTTITASAWTDNENNTNWSFYPVFDGRLALFCIGRPSGTSVSDFVSSTWNQGAGQIYSGYTSDQISRWGTTSYYNLNGPSGDATDQYGSLNLTETNGVGVASGPATSRIDGNPVISITGKESTALVFSQSALNKRSVYDSVNADLNNKQSMIFGSGNVGDLLTYAGNINTSASGWISAVFNPTTVSGIQCIFSTSDEGVADEYCGLFVTNGRLEWRQINNGGSVNVLRGNTVIASGNTYIGTACSSGVFTELYVNNSVQTLSVTGTPSGTWVGDTNNRDNFSVGALKTSAESNSFNGDIAEIIFNKSKPTSSNISSTHSYLNNRYKVY